MHKARDLEDRLINFAVRITHVVEGLPDSSLGTMSVVNSCVLERRQRQITEKLKARSRDEISSTR